MKLCYATSKQAAGKKVKQRYKHETTFSKTQGKVKGQMHSLQTLFGQKNLGISYPT